MWQLLQESGRATSTAWLGLTLLAAFVLRPVLAWLLAEWQAWRLHNALPGPPDTRSFLGHLPAIADDQAAMVVAKWANQYGPVFAMRLAHQRAVVVTDPAAIQRLVTKGPDYADKSAEVYTPLTRTLVPPQRNILTTTDGPLHQAVRQGTATAFATNNMKKLFPIALQLSKAVADELQQAGPAATVNMERMSRMLTSDVMGHMLFGMDLGGVSHDERAGRYVTVATRVSKAGVNMFMDPLWHIKYWNAAARADMRACVEHDACVAERVRELMQNPPGEHTIAGQLLKVRLADGSPLDFNQIKAEIAIFMAASYDTTANALSWALGLLAAHPEVQQKLAVELAAAGLLATQNQRTPRDFKWSDLGRLHYLNAVIKETLRIASPAGLGSVRVTAKDTQLCGHVVPKGTTVFCAFYPVGRSHANYGTDADEFHPERWLAGSAATGQLDDQVADDYLQGSSTAQQGKAASGAEARASGGLPDPLTFSAGPRNCPGQSLARLELQTALAVLLGRFKFELGPELLAVGGGMAAVQACMIYRLTVQPKDGMPLGAVPRA